MRIGQLRSDAHPLQTYGDFARRGQCASKKSGHVSKQRGRFFRGRSPNPVNSLRMHSSKREHSLLEHPGRLSLSMRLAMISRTTVESGRPTSTAICATFIPHPSRNSMRFLSSIPMCFAMVVLLVWIVALSGGGTRPLARRPDGEYDALSRN